MDTKTELKYLIPFHVIEDRFPDLSFETKREIQEFVNLQITGTREETLEEMEDFILSKKNS